MWGGRVGFGLRPKEGEGEGGGGGGGGVVCMEDVVCVGGV